MEQKRNYGIDALRVIAMFYVIVLHCLNKGGLLASTSSANIGPFFIARLMITCAYCAVDIFAIISGYVAYTKDNKPTKYSKYIELWFQVVFYGLLITGIFNIIMPESVTLNNYIYVIFPVSNKLYWYFTAYTGLFVIMPLLNKAINSMDNKTLKKVVITIFIVFSIFESIVKAFKFDRGYSFIWLTLLYIIGASIKKCNIGEHLKPYKAFIGIILLNIITLTYIFFGLKFKIGNVEVTKKLLLSYTSPTIVGQAILYVILFSKLHFKETLKKITMFFAPTAFSIYIVNCHNMIWNHVMNESFVFLKDKNLFIIALAVIAFSLSFSLVVMMIDKIRIYLFKIIKIDELSKKIEMILKRLINKIEELIS